MNIRRRIGAVLCALLGGYLICSVIFTLLDKLQEPTREFRDYLPILLAVWTVLFVLGLALIFAAWRLWQKQRPVKPN